MCLCVDVVPYLWLRSTVFVCWCRTQACVFVCVNYILMYLHKPVFVQLAVCVRPALRVHSQSPELLVTRLLQGHMSICGINDIMLH